MDRSKTARELGAFDCIKAPCVDTCPIDQAVPLYMGAVRRGDLDEAIRITREDNPLPSILGRACDHLCEIDLRPDPSRPAARDPAHQALHHGPGDRGRGARESRRPRPGMRVAIIGAGPAGLAAARELARAGVGVIDLRGAAIRRRHGRRRDPGVPAAAGSARPGPGGPRAPGRGDPLRRPSRRRRHARPAPRRRLRRRSSWRSAHRSPGAWTFPARTPRESSTGSRSCARFARAGRRRSGRGSA